MMYSAMIETYQTKKWIVRIKDLRKIAEEIKPLLIQQNPFILWLRGGLGAGKTTFTAELLHVLGLPDRVPVLSPTYTFMTEYETTHGVMAHLDLYRLADGDDDSVEALLSGRKFAGLIIEWPERALDSSLIASTHELHLFHGEADDQRIFELRTPI
jgi:tRNA threonylcarbamoyladenosine biosynthesis protein TsaE